MDDIKSALLGDKEAAKRVTLDGELIPCPFCGGDADVVAYDVIMDRILSPREEARP